MNGEGKWYAYGVNILQAVNDTYTLRTNEKWVLAAPLPADTQHKDQKDPGRRAEDAENAFHRTIGQILPYQIDENHQPDEGGDDPHAYIILSR